MKIAYLIFVTVMIWNCTIAQNNDDPIEKENAMLIAPIVSVQIPGADLANRFGVAYLMGLSLDYKFGKNWYVGGEGGLLFGTTVKESNHLEHTLAQNGMVITDEGYLDEVNLNLRGGIAKVNFGKSIFFKAEKPSNGMLFKMGVGYMQHKILIDVNKKNTPQLTGQYAKGYDRFSNGILLSQYIGLIRLEKGKFVNVTLGFEITEGFTHNARPYDFYLQEKLTEKRVDMMYGIKFTWMIPVYIGKSSSSQYYTY